MRQHVAFSSAQKSVEKTPLKQWVPACDHRSPLGSVCVGAELHTRESDHSLQQRAIWNTAKTTVTSSHTAHKPSADLSFLAISAASLVSWGTFRVGLCKRVSGLKLSHIRTEQEKEIDGLKSKTALQYFKSQLSSCEVPLWLHVDLIGLSSAKHLF